MEQELLRNSRRTTEPVASNGTSASVLNEDRSGSVPPSMKIKSYFSSSVERAIQDARQEMGSEAMLLTTRRSSPESRHLGAYEVVFGSLAAGSVPSSAVAPADLSQELHNLQTQLRELKSALQVGDARPHGPEASLPQELCRELADADLDRDLAWQIAEEAVAAWRQAQAPQTTRSLRGASLLRQFAVESITTRLRFAAPSAAQPHEQSQVVAFVGPPGAGKTTTLVKFAVQYCLAAQQSVRIISVDPQRVASHEKLRALAAIIGIGFTAAITLNDLLGSLEEFRGKNVILVDTPGYGGQDFDGALDLGNCLARIGRKETHLVLPASMKRADLSRYVRQYELLQPDYLLFTKLDEAESCGAALSTAIGTYKPLSFVTNGQSIPEDLQPATSKLLTAYLNVREPAGATSAA